MRLHAVALLTAAGMLLLTACGDSNAGQTGGPSGTAADPSAQQVTITGSDDMRFNPATVTVQAGRSVQVTLVNAGQLVHDVSLSDGVSSPVKVVANGNQRATSPPFTLDRPGTYTFICSQAGHEAAGMRGTITAQ